jgi:hypothetical protein
LVIARPHAFRGGRRARFTTLAAALPAGRRGPPSLSAPDAS